MELALLMDDEAVTKALFDERGFDRKYVFDLPLYYPLLRAMWTWRVDSGKTRGKDSFAAYLRHLSATYHIENALADEARWDEEDVNCGVLSQDVYFKKYEMLVAQYFAIAFHRFWQDGDSVLPFNLPLPVSATISKKDGISVMFGRSRATRQKSSNTMPENIFVLTRYRSKVLFDVVHKSWNQHLVAARQLVSCKADVELISFTIWLADQRRHLHLCVAVDHNGVMAPVAGTSTVLPTYARSNALFYMVNPSLLKTVHGKWYTYAIIHRTCITKKHTRMLVCIGYAIEAESQQKNLMTTTLVRPSLPTKREDDVQRDAMGEEMHVLFFN